MFYFNSTLRWVAISKQTGIYFKGKSQVSFWCYLWLCYAKCAPSTSSLGTFHGLVKNAQSQALPQTNWIQTCHWTRAPDDLYEQLCLRNTEPCLTPSNSGREQGVTLEMMVTQAGCDGVPLFGGVETDTTGQCRYYHLSTRLRRWLSESPKGKGMTHSLVSSRFPSTSQNFKQITRKVSLKIKGIISLGDSSWKAEKTFFLHCITFIEFLGHLNGKIYIYMPRANGYIQ